MQFIASFWKDEIYGEINVEATTYPHQNICLEGAPSLDSNCSHPSAHKRFFLNPIYDIYDISWMKPNWPNLLRCLRGQVYLWCIKNITVLALYFSKESKFLHILLFSSELAQLHSLGTQDPVNKSLERTKQKQVAFKIFLFRCVYFTMLWLFLTIHSV